MSKSLFSWNLLRTKQPYGQLATDAIAESESFLLPRAEKTEGVQKPQDTRKKGKNLILGVLIAFVWTGFAFSAGSLFANRRHTNDWGSFERGFAEETVVSK